ncbi:SNF2 family N-terminal domain-containing protein [Gigaspora rosea]|uniref:SNF2 family N-terminal domain-containing protein n=1 Tax=Gigaspora rosea TaxID=44941 RepID=A0A397UMH2_9GLOM|nr:SNF2 family N-terminal domain-containing protein [Gigaspora rosea]
MNPETWTLEEVCDWLRQENFERLIEIFKENNVDGKTLMKINVEKLRRLKVPSKDHYVFLNTRELLRSKAIQGDNPHPPIARLILPPDPSTFLPFETQKEVVDLEDGTDISNSDDEMLESDEKSGDEASSMDVDDDEDLNDEGDLDEDYGSNLSEDLVDEVDSFMHFDGEPLSRFRAAKYGAESFTEDDFKRAEEKKSDYGYLRRWMYMEDDELLPVYGESDEEKNYISSDLEEEVMEEEEDIKQKGEQSLFIMRNVDDKESEIVESDNLVVPQVDHAHQMILDYISSFRKIWEDGELQKIETLRYKHWRKLFPRKEQREPQKVIDELTEQLRKLNDERLPQLINHVKSNIKSKSTLDKDAKRQCGILDQTLRSIYLLEWKVSLAKGPPPPKPDSKPRQKTLKVEEVADDKDAMNQEHNSDDSYESDFIDDSEITYTEEQLAELREAGIIIEPVVIETSVTRPSDTTSERPTDKSESADEDKKLPQLLSNASNVEEKHITHNGKEVEIIILDSDSEDDDNETIDKGDKVPEKIVSTGGSDSAKNFKVNNDNDMELDCNDEYIYDDDDECAYLDHKQREEQRILEAESDELFLKYDSQDLMQEIQSAIFYWHWDEDMKKKSPMAPLINDDFTLYLQLQSAISRSMLSPEAVEELKKELPLIPEGKLDAREDSDDERYEKNYIGDSDDDDLTYASGSKSSYRPKKRFRETAEVIEQRKERMALEQGYSRRYAEQEKLADPKDGVIINLGHLENEDHIYIPDLLSKKLKTHQVMIDAQTYQKLYLGKTVQVITFLYTLYTIRSTDSRAIRDHLKAFRVLILCPKIVIDNWENEFMSWLNENNLKNTFPVYKLGEIKDYKERLDLINRWQKNEKGGVFLINYDMFRQLVMSEVDDDRRSEFRKYLLNPGPSLVVADEGHILKNQETQLQEALMHLKTPSRIILTGSPLQNNLAEYWCTINFVCPNYLGSLEDFKRVYINPIEHGLYESADSQEKKTSRKMLFVLSRIIEDIVHRRNVSILERELPPKSEFLITCRMMNRQLMLYKNTLDKENKNLADSNTIIPVNESKTVREYMHHICREYKGLDEISESSKMQILKEILVKCEQIGDKVIIFSKSIPTMNYIERMVLKHDTYIRIDGETQTKERQRSIDNFNKSKLWKVALISIKTGGLGVNMYGANRVILVDGEWNPRRVVDQRNLSSMLSKQDVNSDFYMVPDSSIACKLPDKLDFGDKVLENIAGRNRNRIIDIQRMNIYFNEDQYNLDNEDVLHAQRLLEEEKSRLQI